MSPHVFLGSTKLSFCPMCLENKPSTVYQAFLCIYVLCPYQFVSLGHLDAAGFWPTRDSHPVLSPVIISDVLAAYQCPSRTNRLLGILDSSTNSFHSEPGLTSGEYTSLNSWNRLKWTLDLETTYNSWGFMFFVSRSAQERHHEIDIDKKTSTNVDVFNVFHSSCWTLQ